MVFDGRKACIIKGDFILLDGEDDAVQIGEGEDAKMKIYTKYWSDIDTGNDENSPVSNKIRVHVWVPDYLLDGKPRVLAAHLNGRLYLPKRCRLTRDNEYDSDSDPNNDIRTENVLIDVFHINPYPFTVTDKTAIDNAFSPPTITLIGTLKPPPILRPKNTKYRFVDIQTGTTLKDAGHYKSFSVRYVSI